MLTVAHAQVYIGIVVTAVGLLTALLGRFAQVGGRGGCAGYPRRSQPSTAAVVVRFGLLLCALGVACALLGLLMGWIAPDATPPLPGQCGGRPC